MVGKKPRGEVSDSKPRRLGRGRGKNIECAPGADSPRRHLGDMGRHGSWSKDLSEGKAEELQAVFLYIDEEGNWFFGWNYEKQQPFLIPKRLIKERRDRKFVVKDEGTASALGAIGWPKLLIDE